MKQVTISLPDSFYNSFIEFLKHIPTVTIKEEATENIPDWQKKILDQRRETTKPEDFIPWSEAKKQIIQKMG